MRLDLGSLGSLEGTSASQQTVRVDDSRRRRTRRGLGPYRGRSVMLGVAYCDVSPGCRTVTLDATLGKISCSCQLTDHVQLR